MSEFFLFFKINLRSKQNRNRQNATQHGISPFFIPDPDKKNYRAPGRRQLSAQLFDKIIIMYCIILILLYIFAVQTSFAADRIAVSTNRNTGTDPVHPFCGATSNRQTFSDDMASLIRLENINKTYNNGSPVARIERNRPGDQAWRAGFDHGSLRLRQVDPAEHSGHPRRLRHGQLLPERHADQKIRAKRKRPNTGTG